MTLRRTPSASRLRSVRWRSGAHCGPRGGRMAGVQGCSVLPSPIDSRCGELSGISGWLATRERYRDETSARADAASVGGRRVNAQTCACTSCDDSSGLCR